MATRTLRCHLCSLEVNKYFFEDQLKTHLYQKHWKKMLCPQCNKFHDNIEELIAHFPCQSLKDCCLKEGDTHIQIHHFRRKHQQKKRVCHLCNGITFENTKKYNKHYQSKHKWQKLIDCGFSSCLQSTDHNYPSPEVGTHGNGTLRGFQYQYELASAIHTTYTLMENSIYVNESAWKFSNIIKPDLLLVWELDGKTTLGIIEIDEHSHRHYLDEYEENRQRILIETLQNMCDRIFMIRMNPMGWWMGEQEYTVSWERRKKEVIHLVDEILQTSWQSPRIEYMYYDSKTLMDKNSIQYITH